MRAECVVCGQGFEKTHPDEVLCGYPRCFEIHTGHCPENSKRHRKSPVKVKCVTCGKEFETLTFAQHCGGKCSHRSRRESTRKCRAANPEKVREGKRKHHAANREKVLEHKRKYFAANPEMRRESNRKYYAANRQKILEKCRERYAAKKTNRDGSGE